MTFEETLAAWLPGQRWFAGKGTPITGLAVTSQTTLASGDPGLRHLIVDVTQATGTDSYQLFLGVRADLPGRLEHVRIGPAGQGLTGYDGLHDPDLTAALLAAMAGEESIGPLRFARRPGGHIDTGLESLVLTAEQSNTSLLFGEEAILKVFRRLSPGPNPDLEVPDALATLGSQHVAAPLGWITAQTPGLPTVLAVLSSYLRNAVDGWSLAATSVRDLYASGSTNAAQAGGDFSGEAHRLGEATAEVHRDLAAAFGTRELPARAYHDMSAQMLDRLDRAVAAVPDLVRHDGVLRAAFEAVATLSDPLDVQRIHGDYHLGQVMRTHSGWVLLDFEGEPAVPLEQRRARYPALRDVAGMLRSLHYAARFQLVGQEGPGQIAGAARDWARRNQAAFCAGYARAGGADPGKHGILVRALTLDKAVYEVMYEARNRPSWLPIPLGSIADGAA
ncbi:MAG TPA: aminoglycoside phosphotransferase [Streptosporangiaceae bacterium]|nr:aminoglycoside phosphotransferase [Streptosporangiaceae bacterium]